MYLNSYLRSSFHLLEEKKLETFSVLLQLFPPRDWSLITGRVGLQKMRGGHVKFSPTKRRGAELAIPKGGTTSFGVVLMRQA